jgi:hypothetical protein
MARHRPDHVMVEYGGVGYQLDLSRCRRALVNRQVEGMYWTHDALARAIGLSRSSVSRFFSGSHTSMATTMKVLLALKLHFQEVARELNQHEYAAQRPDEAVA